MTEIRKSANRSKCLHVPAPVCQWVREQLAAAGITPGTRIPRSVVLYTSELLMEASQRPEFADYAENCQTASFRRHGSLYGWVWKLVNNRPSRKFKALRLRTVSMGVRERTELATDGTPRTYYEVRFRRKMSPSIVVAIHRSLPTLAQALSYRDRLQVALEENASSTPEEKAAALYEVPLFESEV